MRIFYAIREFWRGVLNPFYPVRKDMYERFCNGLDYLDKVIYKDK